MRIEMKNEFKPVTVTQVTDKVLDNSIWDLYNHPGMYQPIRLLDKRGKEIANFLITIIDNKNGLFIQMEGFDNQRRDKIFLENVGDYQRWIRVQPGIYRLRLGEPPKD
jgi:hypothetical protein